jgi:hypothetical protein
MVEREGFKLHSTKQVTSIEGIAVQEIDAQTQAPIYELCSVTPIANAFGEYPNLTKSLVQRSDGVQIAVSMLNSNTLAQCAQKYGELKHIVVPLSLVRNNPIIKLQPLKIEYLHYIPFIDNGVKFVMVTMIEYGRREDALIQNEEQAQAKAISMRYVYHFNSLKLQYLPSYDAAIQEIVGKAISN